MQNFYGSVYHILVKRKPTAQAQVAEQRKRMPCEGPCRAVLFPASLSVCGTLLTVT